MVWILVIRWTMWHGLCCYIYKKLAFFIYESKFHTTHLLQKPTTKSATTRKPKRILIAPEYFVCKTNHPDFLFGLQILRSLCKCKGLVFQQRHSLNLTPPPKSRSRILLSERKRENPNTPFRKSNKKIKPMSENKVPIKTLRRNAIRKKTKMNRVWRFSWLVRYLIEGWDEGGSLFLQVRFETLAEEEEEERENFDFLRFRGVWKKKLLSLLPPFPGSGWLVIEVKRGNGSKCL